jgi:hypothetical protein
MKRFVFIFFFLWLGLISSAHAWFFFFIPGSVVQSTGDAISGAKGKMCVKEGIDVGHVFTSTNGNTAKVISLSGTSSICQNPAIPIRAEVEFTYSFASKAGIELTEDFTASSLTDLERFNGFLLKATSSSVKEHGVQISATTKQPTNSIQSVANAIEQRMIANPKLLDTKSQNIETLTINGMPAVRFEISTTLKGVFGTDVTYFYTILEGDGEIVVINVYAPKDYGEEHRAAFQNYAFKVSGLSAKPQVSEQPENAPKPAAASASVNSPEDRLQQLNKMFKSGLITKDEYNVKKKEILKAL